MQTRSFTLGLAVLMGYSPVFLALAAGLEARLIAPPAGIDAGALIAAQVAILGTLLTLWAACSLPPPVRHLVGTN